MKSTSTILAAIFLMAWASLAPAAESLNETLQKGLFEEEANHNLEAAIKAYQSVVQQTEEQRKLAATAIFRLGECYRKLGRTNEATAQYERIAREFSEQTTLANLSRQNLRGLGVSPLAHEALPAPAADGSASLPPAARARLKELLQEEIKIAEAMLAEQRKRVEVGTQAPEEEFRFQKEVAALKRQLLAVDGLDTPEARRQWRDLLLQEISLAEKAVATEQKKLANGRASASEVSRLQREVLASKRELVSFDSAPDQSARKEDVETASTSEEAQELQRIRAIIRDSPDLINARDPAASYRTRLHKASIAGQLMVAKFLLANGADVDALDTNPRTPLHWAAMQGHKAMVELLLANHAAIDGQEGTTTPLHLAVENGHKLVVAVLLEHKANVNARNAIGWTPLHNAALYGYKAMAEVLLAHKADLNAASTDPYHSERLAAGFTPLHVAALKGNLTLVEWLCANGANVNARDKSENTPLHLVTGKSSAALVESLLTSKADVNAKNDYGATPLILASGTSNEKVVQLLLKHGADANAQDNSRLTPVHAAFGQSGEVFKALLSAKPNLEVRNQDGRTPLQRAVLAKNDKIVEMLLAAGADPNVVYDLDPAGSAPLHWAAQNRSTKIVELLLAHKADVNAQDTAGNTPLDYVKINPSGNRRPAAADASLMLEIGDLLRKAGANEDLQRRSFITVTRRNRGFSQNFFYRGTNSYNDFTLLELMAQFFENMQGASGLAYPDFANVKINRLNAKGGSEEIRVDLEEILRSGDCSRDLVLKWGDAVDVPELDHPLDVGWSGLDSQVRATLKKCLARKVEIIVKGQPTKVTLRPTFVRSPGNPFSGETETVKGAEGAILTVFRLRDVVFGARVLLASSDVTRVKVQRKDWQTGEPLELVFNLEQTKPNTDLWLRDGDVIEIPERDPNAPPRAAEAGLPPPPGVPGAVPAQGIRIPPRQSIPARPITSP